MNQLPEKLTGMRQDAEQIFQAGLKAVDAEAAVLRCCHLEGDRLLIKDKAYNLSRFDRVLVLGAGKAGARMAAAVEKVLGDRLSGGMVTVKYEHLADVQKISLHEAGHPIPDENGLKAARAIFALASEADEKTLVILLISGGGSALMPLPVAGVSLQDKQETTRILISCGANIHEINTLRKHLSAIKGGQLARAVYPATLVALVLSDVVGDDLDTIASGPCVPDTRTFSDCIRIIDKYSIADKLPQNVLRHLRAGVAGEIPETPKPGDKVFDRVTNVVVGCNFDALSQARNEARKLGYNTLILSSTIEGETAHIASMHMAMAREIITSGNPLKAPACLLSGGETTVTIRGSGLGGRNQEFALAAATDIADLETIVLLSAGTDGSDGPTDAAGAFADSSTRQRAEAAGLDLSRYLMNNDSYHLFESLGDLYKTGPTNTNVMDLRVLLVKN